jgi:predicted NBD/HSP70 family sugar kinase
VSQQRTFVGQTANGQTTHRQGSNSALVGDFNARVILTALRRRGPASKADLSRIVGLTNNATGMIAKRLETNGLVRSIGKRHGERGQPATMLDLNPEGAYSIGVRIDRGLLETVLVDLRGQVLARDRLDQLPAPDDAIAHLADNVAGMLARLPPTGRMRLNGIGPAEGLRAWGGFDVRAALATATGLPVVLENDGSAAAVGELIYGRGRALDDFFYLFIGPAIGGGIVLGGDYLRGRHRNAGDIGVVPVPASRLPSAPPARDGTTILMARASLAALARHLRFAGATSLVPDAIATHPAAVAEWLDDAADALAWPVLTSAHLLDVGHVVIGGDLPQRALQGLADRLAARLDGIVAERRRGPAVLASSTGGDAAAIGAASLPLHLNFSPMRDGLTTAPREMAG